MVLIVHSLLPESSNFILQMFNFIPNTTIPDISMSLLAHNQYFMFLLMLFHAGRISHSTIFCDQIPIMFENSLKNRQCLVFSLSGGLNEKCLMCLTTWSPVGGDV